MQNLKASLFVLTAAAGLFAQTAPNIDENRNMGGVVEPLKFVNPANTIVSLSSYKDWVTWGAPNKACNDAKDPESSIHPSFYSTRKIQTRVQTDNIQHCHGPAGMQDPGVIEIGSTSFTWTNGNLHPKSAVKSRWSFYTDHLQDHTFPVEINKQVSAKVWVAIQPPSGTLRPKVSFRVNFYPNWDGVTFPRPSPSRTNKYHWNWESNTGGAKDHAYTFNITPDFTGYVQIEVGQDLAPGDDIVESRGPVWLKAFTLQDGRSSGVVTAGTYSPVPFEQQYFIRFRNSGKVMVPDFSTGYNDPPETVRLRTMDAANVNQMWYLPNARTTGFSNIWSKDGGLGSGEYWWVARSLVKIDTNDTWQKIQFVDQGNGYKRMRLKGKGPGGEDLYLTSYTSDEDSDISVYYGGIADQDVQLLQAKPPYLATRYQVRNVNSGKCLAAKAGGTGSGTEVVQLPCNTSNSRLLTLTAPDASRNSLRFEHTGQMINIEGTANGAGASMRPVNTGSNSQKFTLLVHDNGDFSLAFAHTGQCGDISGGSTADNARMVQNPCNSQNRQRFTFVKVN